MKSIIINILKINFYPKKTLSIQFLFMNALRLKVLIHLTSGIKTTLFNVYNIIL